MIKHNKLVIGLTLVAACLAASTSALAEDKKAVGSGPNPFVDCGIGAALFPETDWAAISSNVIWDVGTTAVVSATLSPETCSGKKVKAALFIGNSYEKLVEETAIGQGKNLTTALNLFECAPAQQASVISEVRSSMGQAVAAPGYMGASKIDKAGNLYNIIDKAVSRSCSV